MNDKSVIQEWLTDLTWKQQTVVLSALRGCDGLPKNDMSKNFHKLLRSHVLKNAGTDKTPFMATLDNKSKWYEDMHVFSGNLDMYPTHYILHFIHAAEILGYYHPDSTAQDFWHTLYLTFVSAMHLHCETKEENEERLADGVDSI